MGGPVRALFVASAIVVGCNGDETAAIECSDPIGGELHGVFTPVSQPPITLGTVDPTPTVIHIAESSNHPGATYLQISSNGVYFSVVVAGEDLETTAIVDMRYVGDGKVGIINSCPSRVPSEYRRVSGTVTMSFDGQYIEGWFNAWFRQFDDQ